MRISDWSSDVCSSDLMKAAFRQHALYRKRLQLAAVDRFRDRQLAQAGQRCALGIGGRRHAEAPEQRDRCLVRDRHMAAAVLPIAALAASCVIQWPDTIPRSRRTRRRNPQLAADSLAALEVEKIGLTS